MAGLLFLALSYLAVVSANPTATKSVCKSSEFYYSTKSVCLPHGGPVKYTAPPAQKQCPTSGWYWHEASGCCVPTQPPPSPKPAPKCDKDWTWQNESQCCVAKSSTCKSSEFYYPPRSSCLPHGGPHNPPSAPPQKQCPPTNWYWSHEFSCCVPSHPPPSGPQPPPQCNKSWDWNPTTACCEPHHYPAPPTPKPSGVPYRTDSNKNQRHKRMAQMSRERSLCPSGLSACPVNGLFVTQANNRTTHDYECMDIYNELTSCGGCASIGEGQNCGSIRGAWNVGCEVGKCKVYTCQTGYRKSMDSLSCLPI